MRSESKYPSRMVISCNPDPDHKIKEMIQWYLTEDGYPIQERDGVVRWFIMMNGAYEWADTRQELVDKYKELNIDVKPVSFSFISSNIYDNPKMLETNGDYLSWLEGLNPIDKARLLHGNWEVRPLGSMYFNRKWVQLVDTMPLDVKKYRAYDKAGSAPSDIEPNPDFTAGIGVAKSKDGYIYIFGDYHPKFKDDGSTILGRFRKTVGERDNILLLQAKQDGDDVTIVFPQDPSAAGKFEFMETAKRFQSEGYTVKKDPMTISKSKMAKFAPFAAACENGLVKFVHTTFDKPTLEQIFKDLEAFSGLRSGRQYKDDVPDCIASGYNVAMVEKTYVVPRLAAIDAPTIKSQLNL